jgi:type II secretory pathway pseudopilin PulG
MRIHNKPFNKESGFSLVEALIAIVIMGGGLLALATAFAQGMILASTTHYHQFAKEKATEAMESVFTARDAGRLKDWEAINNQTGHPKGIFLNGAKPLKASGADGLVNTSDDGALEKLPGNDGIYGTADDETLSMTREVRITEIETNLRQIEIIITYRINGIQRDYRLTSFISPFA